MKAWRNLIIALVIALGVGVLRVPILQAVTASYNFTIRVVDSAGNVLDGQASAVTASYNSTVRVVDSTGHVLDSLGGNVATTSFTSAQLKALDTTPITLVPTPGANKLNVVTGMEFVYKFGTIAYQGNDTLNVGYGPDPTVSQSVLLNYSTMLKAAASRFQFQPGQSLPTDTLASDTNQPIMVALPTGGVNVGPIVTTTLGAGGAGYAANDTGTITTGGGDAEYKVLTVNGGGAVLTYSITTAGNSYAVGNGQATAVGGGQPGVGVGLTINITAVQTGDGTLQITTYYRVISVP